MPSRSLRIETRSARAGSSGASGTPNPPVQPPIYQSAIFDLGATADAEAIFSGARKGYAYARFGNPTVDELAATLADLEGGAEALVTSSGNAATLCAITAAMQDRPGPLVSHYDIYGGSFELLRILETAYRVPVQLVDATDPDAWLAAVAKAGVVLLETPSNPLMRLIDLEATVAAAQSAGAPVIVDNTVATPVNQRPFEFGVDWVVHSTTKYLNGHSDLVGGCLISRQPLTRTQRSIHKNLGGTVNAFEAWLVLRGLRTFALRMGAHNTNAARIAQWLENRPEVSQVYYPGLPSHPQYALFQRQMTAGGGLLSFELAGDAHTATAFLDRLELIVHAVSLGGPETLITRPAGSSHRGMSPEARKTAGVSDTLMRLAVGIEAADDLIADIQQALEGSRASL